MRSCGSDNVHMRQRRPLRAGFVAGVCTAVAAEGGRARRAGTLARWGCRPIVRAGLRARRLGGRASPDGPLSSSRGSVPWRPQKSENLAWICEHVTRSVIFSFFALVTPPWLTCSLCPSPVSPSPARVRMLFRVTKRLDSRVYCEAPSADALSDFAPRPRPSLAPTAAIAS